MKISSLALLFTLSLLLSGCGMFTRKVEVEASVTDVPIPILDCRPYPKPDKLVLEDVEPENRADGWLLSHEDYLRLAADFKAIKSYVIQSRAAASYLVDCIEAHNDKVKEHNQALTAPAPEKPWWKFGN